MRINTNIASLRTQTQMLRTSKALQRALERLSSGQRINSARDDASGLARGVGLESQVRGFNRAILNMNEAQGMLMTAEGALQTQMDLVQRMRELAVQAANGTLTSNDRANLDQELQSLMAEFNRLTRDTKFNGAALLDGSLGTQKIQVGTEKNQSVDLTMGSMAASEVFRKDVGSGAFASATTLGLGGAPVGNQLADLNGDGHLDLVVGLSNGIFEVFDGRGDGTFATARTYSSGFGSLSGELELGDVTGDGHIDIVSATAGDGLVILAGRGDGSFGVSANIPNIYDFNDVALADFNGDGVQDILYWVNDIDDLMVALSDGDGSFTQTLVADLFYGNSQVLAGDFNGDGHQDAIFGGDFGGGAQIYFGNGSGGFTYGGLLSGLPSDSKLAAGDFDRDGDLDLAAAGGGSLRFAFNNGLGVFGLSATNYVVGSGLTSDLEVGDLNDDGWLDLVTLNSSSISILLGSGSGNFTYGTTRSTNVDSVDLALGDLNNDGAIDLVAGDYGSGFGNSLAIFNAVLTTAAADNEVRIQTQAQAQKLLGILDNAIDRISEERSNLGALSHRLDYAQSVTSQTRENLASARSQIMDADLAEETAELTRLQILQQAQASVLAQSNLSLRIALQLLSF